MCRCREHIACEADVLDWQNSGFVHKPLGAPGPQRCSGAQLGWECSQEGAQGAVSTLQAVAPML